LYAVIKKKEMEGVYLSSREEVQQPQTSVGPDYLMAIDAGTGSCRAVIFDKSGAQVVSAQEEWSHETQKVHPGSQIFDTENNWRLISSCIRKALFDSKISPNSIKAISSTSMREGMILYDSSGKEIWACPNVDSRATKEAEYLVRSGKAKKIFQISGDWVSISDSPRFLWIKKHEKDIFHKISHMGMISDWILYKLTGQFVTDPSIGSSSGMFDLKNQKWSNEIISMCGLREDIFPEVRAPGSVIGGVTRRASLETHLVEGTPVVVGGADTQLGLVGLGVAKPNQVTLLGGSFWQLTMLLDKPIIDPQIRLRTLCHVIPNRWMIEGIGFYCGLTMRWFRDAFCDKEKGDARRTGVDPYFLMEKEASLAPPGSNGVIGIFSNLMNSKRWTHASPAFMQFDITSPSQSGKKECIRAIEESAAFVALGHLKILESLVNGKPKEITFAGGGSKGFLWPKIVSDVLGIRVKIPVVSESTALGAAICAGVGVGVYKNVESAGKEIALFEKTYEPTKSNHEKYLSYYDKWLKLYDEVLGISERGLLKPLWKAAGA
jgi:autoinducer 2 (AI-2) kinase